MQGFPADRDINKPETALSSDDELNLHWEMHKCHIADDIYQLIAVNYPTLRSKEDTGGGQ